MKPSNLILGISLLLAGGCHQHPLTDYRPLDQAGMGSSAIEQLKPFNISDPEIQQLVSLKHASISDETCVALISTARGHHHSFTSSESVGSLLGARYTESDILGFARADKLDVISGEKQVLDRINDGMTEEQAEKEANSREAIRNHAHTDFVRVRGRKPR
jgi:hypothetical protein